MTLQLTNMIIGSPAAYSSQGLYVAGGLLLKGRIMDFLEIVTDLQSRQNAIGEQLLSLKEQNNKNTKGYKLRKYQYQQLKNAIAGINNSRMAIEADFTEDV